MLSAPAPDAPPVLPVGLLYGVGAVVSSVDVELRVLVLAARLRELAVRPGDRVLLRLDNSADHLVALLALLHLDTSLVLFDHREPVAELRRVARIARVRWVVSSQDAEPVGMPGFLLEELLDPAATPPPDSCLSLAAWSRREDALVTWSRDATGGLTGVVRSGHRVLLGLEQARRCVAPHPTEVLLPLLPCAQVYGLTLVLLAWTSGSSLALAPTGRQLEHSVGLADRCGVTAVTATAATYEALLDLLGRRPELLGRLRYVRSWWCGGAAPVAELAVRFEQVMGRSLLRGWAGDEPGAARPDTASGAWVLHRDAAPVPVTAPDVTAPDVTVLPDSTAPDVIVLPDSAPAVTAQNGTAGELRSLLEAVRDDPETLTRILGRLVQRDELGAQAPVQAPVQGLVQALATELDEMLRGLSV